jgi:hypothetical protein
MLVLQFLENTVCNNCVILQVNSASWCGWWPNILAGSTELGLVRARLNLSDGFVEHMRPANTICKAINYRRHLLYEPRSL